MSSFNFDKWNKITGWLVFAIALLTYWLTVEPTASFWDAGEYITTASNLEVGHPPGAPLYQIMGAFFSIFAMDPSNIALTINLMSVFASAFAILFMFWSLTMLLRMVVQKHQELNTNNRIAIIGSAAVGALSFTFTDSFWYNAVEAEVYASGACVLSILFYCALRWEREMNTPRGDRWLILIAFIIGLSFGIHFMALLAIPAMGFLYYFKNYKTITLKNFLIANVVTVAILLLIFKLLLPYTMKLFSAFELFFVNSLGMPFNSGTIIAGLLFIGLFYFGLRYTRKKNLGQVNTLLLCVLFIFIGFSSWLMLPIRANAGTVINENNPNNARELLAYYNREQYPETHLFYGPLFTEMYSGLDTENPYKDDKPKYEKDEATGKYIIVNQYKDAGQNLDDNHKVILPRMWSPDHNANYLEFTDGLEFTIKSGYRSESRLVEIVANFKQAFKEGKIDKDDYNDFLLTYKDYLDIKPPSVWDNLAYTFEYQFGYMYWRYFMWNFAGRQDDVQGQKTDLHGNWLTGISFIDELRLGTQDNLPSDVKYNKARNTYYLLPLILGVLGVVFHFKNDMKTFWVLLVLFLFTGLALKVYLNERPFEPRERDYALVGSFYVFAMWIGFGVYALYEMLKEAIKPKLAIPIVLTATLLASPVILAYQNWDDHDRSGRYTANSMGKMYLDSCDENAILFTIGDNDTFALWYAQNIEGYRRDVRIVNTSLFATDWYIDDMKKKAFESDPIPSQLSHDKYRTGTRDFLYFQESTRDTIDIKQWMNWVESDDPRTKVELESNHWANTFPSKTIRIPVDKEAVLRNGIVAQKDADLIVPYIDITLKGNVIYKNRMMMLDVIANNNWERPIYFSGGSFGDDDYIWMKDYLQLDGVTYKLVPIKTPVAKGNPFDMGRIDADKMYDIVMNFDWGNSGSPDIYHDTETRRNGITYRSNLARLAETLMNEKKMDKAENVLDLAMEKMPVKDFEYYSLLEPYVLGYYEVDNKEKARKLFKEVSTIYQEKLLYYSGMKIQRQFGIADEIISDMEKYRGLVDILIVMDSEEFARPEASKFNDYLKLFRHFYSADEGMDVDKRTERDLLENDTNAINLPLDTVVQDNTNVIPEQ
ncbi:glycosyltransferase family 117 protein [Rasiella sp. SM2506]|uniref:glycosyltransferase family 117 protein n=1 Tax=Rasiella sp. SM2506 TaxID=3423914 RepID=UPI003D79E3FC